MEESKGDIYPEFYHFPPFWTPQITEATKATQIDLWINLILKYHESISNVELENVSECELFVNNQINRVLDQDFRRVILNEMIQRGYAEWDTIEVYELSTDLTNEGEPFPTRGIHPRIVRKAIEILEHEGKCDIFKGTTSEEDGVKFYDVNSNG